MNKYYILSLLFGIGNCLQADLPLGPLSSFFNVDLEQQLSFGAQLEKEIEILQKRKAEQEETLAVYKKETERVQAVIKAMKEKAAQARGVEAEFNNKKVLILNQIQQTLIEIEQLNQELIAIYDEHIKILKEHKDDPDFKSKKLTIGAKSIYTIADLSKESELLLQFDTRLKALDERLKKSASDLEARKKTAALSKQEYEEKRREQKELKSKNDQSEDAKTGFSIKQRGEIIDLEERLLFLMKELADLRVKELEYRTQLIQVQIKIEKLQAETVENELERIKNELRLDEKDLQQAEATLKQHLQESTRIQQEYSRRLESLDTLRSNEYAQISQIKHKYHLSDADIEAMGNWTYIPKTVEQWDAAITIGRLRSHIKYEIDISKDYLLAQIEYEKARITDYDLDNLITISWYRMSKGQFDRAQEDINKEIKHYEKIKTDLQTHISVIQDRRTTASAILNANSSVTEAIKNSIKELRNQKEITFKVQPVDYVRLGTDLKQEISQDATRRGEAITQLLELYTNIGNILKLSIRKVDAILAELKTKQQWRGVPPLWKGLQDFVPDLSRFSTFVKSKSIVESIGANQRALRDYCKFLYENPSYFFSLLLELLILILIFLVIKLYLPDVIYALTLVNRQYGIGYTISSFINTTFLFINNHLASIFLWFVLFLGIHYRYIADVYTGILFYLLSIPYWLFMIYRYIDFVEHVNAKSDYIFVSQQYQRRFLIISTTILCSTVIILFFREAFLLAPLSKSYVPTALLALHFVLIQIAIICLMSKDQVLKLIPRSHPAGQWLYDILKKYFYAFFAASIFVIVMSNPYIGYGPQFFFVISRIISILLIIPLFVMLYNQMKNFSTRLFFVSNEDVSQERFAYSRTLFGIFLIVSFIFFVCLALVISFNIWGYQVGWRTISEWLSSDLYNFTEVSTGKTIGVNPLRIIKVGLYIFAGIALAYIVNRFILGRMFDLLLVNIGIQNAIMSFVRFTIILGALIIALQSIGLSSSLVYIFAVLGGISVAGKELITDFIGYFVILVQRPIKIGDLIKLIHDNEEITGVVRHINLRSVILRKKNSVTLIVPNSMIMTTTIVNWNYARTCFAFEDVYLTVHYNVDPAHVKGLILQVLDNNLNVLKNPAPIVWLHNFTENGFLFMVRGFLSPDKVLEQWEISSNIRLEIVRMFRTHGIEVASPTRVLRLVNDQNKL